MDVLHEILRALGRIEGELIQIRKLNERVSQLEVWQSWLKGAGAVVTRLVLSRLESCDEVIDFKTVGAVYDRPRCFRFNIVGGL